MESTATPKKCKFENHADVLARLIIESFKPNNLESLTIGVLGEWGSGKTQLLKDIKDFIEKNNKPTDQEVIIPVVFNAWRFEKEEHLIIPLLKTCFYEIQKIRDKNRSQKIEKKLEVKKQSYFQKIRNIFQGKSSVEHSLKLAQKHIGSFIIAAASSLEADLKVVKFKGKDFMQSLKEQYEEDVAATTKKNISKYESIYFDILSRFAELTKNNIKLVFLIDDLDRCLPENALKMLESIKLFLDVKGCAFVLAVDDEVVERGVEHHYRDYGKDEEQIISGAEYLEKMINLPYKLPSLEEKDIIECLKTFAIFRKKEQDRRDSPQLQEAQTEDNNENELIDIRLIEYFAKTIPPIMRKIIRAVNLYETKLQLLQKSGMTDFNRKLILNLIFLELFAPNLYRYIKNNYNAGYEALIVWKQEHESLHNTNRIQNSNEAIKEEKVKKNLAKLLQELQNIHHDNRNRFDLDAIFDKHESIEICAIQSYFTLKDLCKRQSLDKTTASKIILTDDARKTLLERLFDAQPFIQKQAFEGIEGKILDKESAKAITEKMQANPRIVTYSWLELLEPYLDNDDFVTIIKTSGIIANLTREINNG